ncbi:MAG TPA: hypothetical protein VJK51_02940 [Candidatus Nanoarchaeia archaeon]|nr:hypothetical protein [Candidatus Nanoarchaeia archaeon]
MRNHNEHQYGISQVHSYITNGPLYTESELSQHCNPRFQGSFNPHYWPQKAYHLPNQEEEIQVEAA